MPRGIPTDVRCLFGFIRFWNPYGDDTPVWFQFEPFVSIPTEVPGPFGFNQYRDYIMTMANNLCNALRR